MCAAESSATELLQRAAQLEDDEYRDAIQALAGDGAREALDAAASLVTSPDSAVRRAAVDVIDVLGYKVDPIASKGPFVADRIKLLVDAADREAEGCLLIAIADALGDFAFDDTSASSALVRLADHPDADVRTAVARGLSGNNAAAIAALIGLMDDAEPDVREWATFSLGRDERTDTHEVRDALVARLDDPEPDVRLEAVVGLGLRREVRALEPLIAALDDGTELDATPLLDGAVARLAAATHDSRLCSALRAIAKQGVRRWGDEWADRDVFARDVLAALEACEPSE